MRATSVHASQELLPRLGANGPQERKMPEKFKAGDEVEWASHGGTARKGEEKNHRADPDQGPQGRRIP